jgi:hypothetical protein
MDILESQVHSFIVKLWVERDEETGNTLWHGHITHVPGGERLYLKKLTDINDFIANYLGEPLRELRSSSKLWQWLRRLSLGRIR